MSLSVSLAFATYFAILLVIGLISYRRSKDATDFIVGGRSLNFYVTALSAHASDMSSWLFMAYPALIFTGGGKNIWVAIGLISGMWANWTFIAPKLRTETERTGSLTLAAYFERRFHDHSRWLRTIGAGYSLLFFTFYVAAGLVGIGLVFETALGFDRIVGMTVGVVIVSVYTMIGGYYSIAWVDLFQALFLLVAIILVPIFAAMNAGNVIEAVQAKGLSFSPFTGNFFKIAFPSLGWGLGYFGQTHILSKFMGINDPKALVKSKWTGLSWQTICLAAATAIGFIAIAYFPGSIANAELAFPRMVKELFHPFISTLILCGILAATISTMDSQILVLVSVLTEDIYHRFFVRRATGKQTVHISRIFVVAIGVLAYIAALLSNQSVLGLVFYSWSGLGSTFGPVLILALHSKRVNFYGAVTGMIFGGLISIFWPWLGVPIPVLIPGFLFNVVLIYCVSLATKSLTINKSR